MTTSTLRIEHPAAVKGRARGYWVAGQALRLGINIASLTALAWAVNRAAFPSLTYWHLVLLLAVFLAGRVAVGRLRWNAWAEVPGAWLTFASDAEAAQAAPNTRADQWLTVLNTLVTVAGGAYISRLPGEWAAPAVGLFGGFMVVMLGAQVGRAAGSDFLERARLEMFSWAVAAAPAVVWSLAGDATWARQGALLALPVVVVVAMLKHAYRTIRHQPGRTHQRVITQGAGS